MTAPVSPGDVLAGKYRVERVLGVGGMGVVVAATHLQLGQRVALKFLLPDAVKNADVVARFAREARAAVQIHSEHVARVTDVGALETGAPYMVMEYLEGSDLSEVIRGRGALPIPTAVDFVLQGLEAIAEAHAAGITHRDLKPGNLFLAHRKDGSPIVKVLDFGISKATLGESEAAMTKTTAIMGSPLYMSPEQLRSSKSVDGRADIWSIGVILHELVTGKVPFNADTMPQLCGVILTEPPPPLRSIRPEAPPGLEAVVERCLEKDLSKRFQNVAELAMALVEFGSPESRLSAQRIAGVIQAAGMAPPSLAPAQSAQGVAPLAVSAVTAQGGPQATTTAGVAAPQPARSPVPLVFAILGAVLVVAVAGVFVLRRGASGAPAEPAASAQPTAEAPKAPATISVRIAATPPEAKIFLDDAALPGNPYTASLKLDSAGHRLRAEAAGFETQTQFVVFDKDVSLDLALTPVAPAAAPSATAKAASGKAAAAAAPAPAAAPAGHRKIDSTNPYR